MVFLKRFKIIIPGMNCILIVKFEYWYIPVKLLSFTLVICLFKEIVLSIYY